MVQSRRKPLTSYTHGDVTAAWKSDLYSTPKCAVKGRSGSAQTTCQFHDQELHAKVHGALMAHSQVRKFISSGRADVKVVGKVELSTRPRWPSQSQNRFANQVSIPSPGAGHKTNRQPRCASEAHAAHMIYAWRWIGAQSQHGCAAEASASPPGSGHKERVASASLRAISIGRSYTISMHVRVQPKKNNCLARS